MADRPNDVVLLDDGAKQKRWKLFAPIYNEDIPYVQGSRLLDGGNMDH